MRRKFINLYKSRLAHFYGQGFTEILAEILQDIGGLPLNKTRIKLSSEKDYNDSLSWILWMNRLG